MKLFLLLNFVLAYENDAIAYLCDRCDLYDVTTGTIFDELSTPGLEFRGPRPIVNNTKPTINITCNADDGNKQKSPTSILSDRITLMCATACVIIGLINLVTTVTILVTERKISPSARKTYMQTAILENE